MKTKYFNDAIIGNKNLKATFSKKGELLRLYYPNIDYRQFIDEFMVGIKVNDSRLINLADDVNNIYSQNYIEQTNILNTEITNTYFNLKVVQTDCISTKENILIKRYKFINNNNIKLNIDLLLHSKYLRPLCHTLFLQKKHQLFREEDMGCLLRILLQQYSLPCIFQEV